jgi:hypothetical protein
MISNLEKYKEDLKSLVERGNLLLYALSYEHRKSTFEENVKEQLGEKSATFLKKLPSFNDAYQPWYSEAKALVRQLLPDRIEDFARLYEAPKTRKEITFANYTIEDCLQGLTVHSGHGFQKQRIVGPEAAIPRVQQQVAMIEAAQARFKSSLFDIRQLLQADLFDSELEAAGYLLKSKFSRAAGAMAGVVLEKHLGEVCSSHRIVLRKKNPAISDLNDALKKADVIDTAQWRFVQHLGDIRNLCDHKKHIDPTTEQVQDFLDGTAKVTKAIF